MSDERIPMGSIKINSIWVESVSLALSDQALDRIIDDLVVAAGGRRGFTSEKLNIARWDLKAALKAEAKRQATR